MVVKSRLHNSALYMTLPNLSFFNFIVPDVFVSWAAVEVTISFLLETCSSFLLRQTYCGVVKSKLWYLCSCLFIGDVDVVQSVRSRCPYTRVFWAHYHGQSQGPRNIRPPRPQEEIFFRSLFSFICLVPIHPYLGLTITITLGPFN